VVAWLFNGQTAPNRAEPSPPRVARRGSWLVAARGGSWLVARGRGVLGVLVSWCPCSRLAMSSSSCCCELLVFAGGAPSHRPTEGQDEGDAVRGFIIQAAMWIMQSASPLALTARNSCMYRLRMWDVGCPVSPRRCSICGGPPALQKWVGHMQEACINCR
jgi:hypothetical protein